MHIVFQNPEIIFYHTFCIFNLGFFRALILQKCIGSMYLLPATSPTVFGQYFSNFTGAFRMVWRYAYCFFRILKLFFITFFAFLTHFFRALILQKCIGSMYLVKQLLLHFLGQSFWNFTHAFRPILFKLYRPFSDGLKICILFFSESWNYFTSLFIAFLT